MPDQKHLSVVQCSGLRDFRLEFRVQGFLNMIMACFLLIGDHVSYVFLVCLKLGPATRSFSGIMFPIRSMLLELCACDLVLIGDHVLYALNAS